MLTKCKVIPTDFNNALCPPDSHYRFPRQQQADGFLLKSGRFYSDSTNAEEQMLSSSRVLSYSPQKLSEALV